MTEMRTDIETSIAAMLEEERLKAERKARQDRLAAETLELGNQQQSQQSPQMPDMNMMSSMGGGGEATMGGGEVMAGTGDIAGGSSGSMGGAMASAWPAALAAAIVGNESHARDNDYRSEDTGEYAKDLLTSAVGNQDIEKRWLPKIGIKEGSDVSKGISYISNPLGYMDEHWF
jgi:hypothetical protein